MRQAGVSPPPGSTRSITTCSAWPRITPGRRLAAALADCPRVAVDLAAVETNIVLARLRRGEPAQGLVDELAAEGLLCITLDRRTLRFVTHLDVDDEALEAAGEIARRVLT